MARPAPDGSEDLRQDRARDGNQAYSGCRHEGVNVPRPPLARVAQAATALGALGMRRSGSTVVNWMAVKWAVASRTDGLVSPTDVRSYCAAWFKVPGRKPKDWFEPFAGEWKGGSDGTNGGWPISSVWTQIQGNRSTRTTRQLIETGEVDKQSNRMPAAVPTGDDYVTALGQLAEGGRIPLLHLAVWRYRLEVPPGATDEGDLVAAVVTELGLTDEEIEALFERPAAGQFPLNAVPVTEWDDADLLPLLPAPVEQARGPGAGTGTVEPSAADDDYRDLEPWAELPLEVPDSGELVRRTLDLVQARELVLPDPEELVERCVLALLAGHLVLEGPPGTAKTTLARLLAEAFNCSSRLETATADWSTFDVIGGLAPSRGAEGREELAPFLGHVTASALECARQARRHDADPDAEPQGHWLVLDELNRAEIDKAIGGLYSVLAGERDLALWFSDAPGRGSLRVPRRYRIVGTMNTVDSSFVYSFSQGLTRRFGFVYVGVPTADQAEDEMTAALGAAARWVADTYPLLLGPDRDQVAAGLASDPRLETVAGLLRDLVVGLRNDADGGWPVGTAQVVDVLKMVVLSAGDPDRDLVRVLDLAIADRVVPQMSGAAPSTVVRARELLLATGVLRKATQATVQLTNTQTTNYA